MGNLINFRPIGNGKIIRSGRLIEANDYDKAKLKNLSTIIDLRKPSEVAKDPEAHLFPQCKSYNLSLISDAKHKELLENYERNVEGAFELMDITYDELFTSKEAISSLKQIFSILLDAKGDVLFHCSWGKDRTGIVAMFIQYVLGDSWDKILSDYLLSNEMVYDERERVKQEMRDNGASDLEIDLFHVSCLVDERFLNHGLDTLNKKYGNLDTFIDIQLQVDEAATTLLRQKYKAKRGRG